MRAYSVNRAVVWIVPLLTSQKAQPTTPHSSFVELRLRYFLSFSYTYFALITTSIGYRFPSALKLVTILAGIAVNRRRLGIILHRVRP